MSLYVETACLAACAYQLMQQDVTGMVIHSFCCRYMQSYISRLPAFSANSEYVRAPSRPPLLFCAKEGLP